MDRCVALRRFMRQRPCLPCNRDGSAMSYNDVCSGIRLPLYSCPYIGCSFCTDDRCIFLHHVAGGVSDTTHLDIFEKILTEELDWIGRLDYVYGAAAVAERERWPRIGLSTTRRALNMVCQRYNDDTIKCLACFVCAQLRTTVSGYPHIDLSEAVQNDKFCNTEVEWRGAGAFDKLEADRPGTLLNNCSYDLWQRRYVVNQEKQGCQNPLQATQLMHRKRVRPPAKTRIVTSPNGLCYCLWERNLWCYLDALKM